MALEKRGVKEGRWKIKFKIEVDLLIFKIAKFNFEGKSYVWPPSPRVPPEGVGTEYCSIFWNDTPLSFQDSLNLFGERLWDTPFGGIKRGRNQIIISIFENVEK